MQLLTRSSSIQLSIADVKTDCQLLSHVFRNNNDVFNHLKTPIFVNDLLYMGSVESIDPDDIESVTYLQHERLPGGVSGNGIISICTKKKAV